MSRESVVGMCSQSQTPSSASTTSAVARQPADWLRPRETARLASSASRRPEILIVDDDRVYLTELQMFFEEHGFDVSGRQALAHLESSGLPDLILVDYLLPGMSSLALAAMVSKRCDVPIVMMSTSQVDSPSVAEALEVVAHDFVDKPIEELILLARIKRLLRGVGAHARFDRPHVRVNDRLHFELGRCVAVVAGQELRLSPSENKLLFLLLSRAGRVQRVEYLVRKLWPMAESLREAQLRILIHRVRRKIEPEPQNPRYLHTRKGLGYFFTSF